MVLTHFHAENYRNIPSATLAFAPGVNLLFGANAQGKTNILEGIYTFARGKSFRSSSDAEQVRFGERGFSLDISFLAEGRERSLSYRYLDGARQRKRNGAPVSLSEMIGSFRAVLFYPEHLQLAKGGPAERRLFLNIALSQLDPLYMRALSQYGRNLEERNSLLKMAQRTGWVDRDQIEAFSHGMAHAAALIHGRRRDYIEKLSRHAAAVADLLSGGRERLALSYKSDLSLSLPACERAGERGPHPDALLEDYRALFTLSLSREIAAGTSLFGVHRDDMEISLCELPVRSFGSQGQQRTAVLALKLAEGEVAHEESGEYPVFLFDDVLSELDEERRSFVLSGVGDRQMILTACERGGIGSCPAHTIYVEGGSYDPSYRER